MVTGINSFTSRSMVNIWQEMIFLLLTHRLIRCDLVMEYSEFHSKPNSLPEKILRPTRKPWILYLASKSPHNGYHPHSCSFHFWRACIEWVVGRSSAGCGFAQPCGADGLAGSFSKRDWKPGKWAAWSRIKYHSGNWTGARVCPPGTECNLPQFSMGP